MNLIVNGVEHELASPPLTPLLHVLREELGITSPKAGCLQGRCGTCTVLVNGDPRKSCLVPLAMANGAEITTVDGLGGLDALSPVQAAFHAAYAAQCGFCTSGMVIAAHALLERRDGALERDEIIEALSGHFCRCTGYVKIFDAIEAASRGDVAVPPELEPEPGKEPEVLIPGSPA